MIKSIIDCLENTANRESNKIAYVDSKKTITFKELESNSKRIGTYIAKNLNITKKPIAIFIDKTVECIESMIGTIYSGNFYTIIDVKSPEERINSIINTLKPITIITNNKNLESAKKIQAFNNIIVYEDIIETNINEIELNKISDKIIDTDAMYILFTSGSTGIPKGTVISHKAVISYINWVKEAFDINEKTIFGSQTPFYFSMSILDVYTTILTGATLYIIPKMYFSFPIKLVEFLRDNKINTIYWVPSALGIVANLKALEGQKLPDLNKILFAGEVMPVKQLNEWKKHIPNALYANLYGPTETTDICTYYIVDREFENTENLPIGKSCDNCNVIVIKEDFKEAKIGEVGELCVRGSFLASGYYNNIEKTKEVFIQNPLNKEYPEIIYKTGDLVKYNENKELIYISRKDFQIKHMGYRIELGEIETVINNIEGVILCACVYDNKNEKIVLYYQGNNEKKQIQMEAKEKLLSYMVPNEIIKVEKMPYNANGKIDRVKLKNMLGD